LAAAYERSTTPNAASVIGNQGGLTEIAFAYPAQGVYYHLYLRPDHLIARETEATPDHEISNIFSYP